MEDGGGMQREQKGQGGRGETHHAVIDGPLLPVDAPHNDLGDDAILHEARGCRTIPGNVAKEVHGGRNNGDQRRVQLSRGTHHGRNPGNVDDGRHLLHEKVHKA